MTEWNRNEVRGEPEFFQMIYIPIDFFPGIGEKTIEPDTDPDISYSGFFPEKWIVDIRIKNVTTSADMKAAFLTVDFMVSSRFEERVIHSRFSAKE